MKLCSPSAGIIWVRQAMDVGIPKGWRAHQVLGGILSILTKIAGPPVLTEIYITMTNVGMRTFVFFSVLNT